MQRRTLICEKIVSKTCWIVLLCLATLVSAVPASRAADKPPAGIRLAQIVQRGPRAQPRADATAAADEGALDGVFLPPDRQAKRRLEVARDMLQDGRYGEAVRFLGSLLEGSEDFFFKPDPSKPAAYRSLKAEAGRLIGEMPVEGRDSYELQFGARARHMLSEAAAAGDVAGIGEVARRFFYTKAGYEATLLIARHHLDHDRPLAAALCFQRLKDACGSDDRYEPMLSLSLATCWVRCGMQDKAQQALNQFKQQYPHGEVRIGDRTVKLFGDSKDALAWLADKAGAQRPPGRAAADEWAMFHGDAQRNAVSAGGQPLLMRRWSWRCAEDDPNIERLVVQARQAYLDNDIVALPSMQPLAVGDVVLMRTARNLLAVNFATGKLVWTARSTADRSFEQLAASSGRNQAQLGQDLLLQGGLKQRMFNDTIFGNLSSDGQQVFVVEDLSLMGNANNNGMPFQPRVVLGVNRGRNPPNINGGPKSTNRLTARELKTEGKLKWEVGGNNGEDEPKLAGAFFLGPPLPLLGHLYVLAEMKGQEIRLLVLSAKTGQLEWSQQLAVVENSILQDPFRRAAGAMPSFADGVLVCPTAAGAVVAIDLTTRSLLWGYQYPRDQRYAQANAFRMMGGMVNANGADAPTGDRWVDGIATIADGCVLIAPVEDEWLYCLNLLDGRLLWKNARGTNLYVGCAHKGNALLVGHNQLSSVQLSDGKAAWGPLELPSGATPSGRGYYSGKYYYLPLSTAEVAQIDLEKGEITSRTHSRQGTIPGNLICYHGDVISQGVDYVETYPQIDSLRKQVNETLAVRPEDPAALAELGEIKLDEGQLAEAIRLFRRSFELDPDDATRQILVESLLEGLQADFAANRGTAQELERLIDGKSQQITYLRLIAAGLQKSGERLAAFDTYLKLADQEATPSELDPLSDVLQARRDRWIQVQLSELQKNASSAELLHMDDAIRQRLAAIGPETAPQALRNFLDVFGGYPASDEVRERLAVKLTGGDTLLEREQLLLRLSKSPDPARARAAVARLAALLRDVRRPELAAIYYRQLAGPLAAEVCLDGKTGSQLVEAVPVDAPVRSLLADPKPWPVGLVETPKTTGRALSGNRHQRSMDLDIHGDPGPFFRDVSLSLDQQQQALVAEDGLGNERFRIGMNDGGNARRVAAINGAVYPSMSNFAGVNGNLLMVWQGTHIVAVDTLRSKDSAGSRLLWSHDLMLQQQQGMNNLQGVHPRQVNVPWGPARFVPVSSNNRLLGSMSPPTDNGVCFQRFRDLVCVDPLSGDVLWTRKNLPLGCELFCDNDVLIAAPQEGGDALVLRMLDGELLAKRPLPPAENRMATIGRTVLTWQAKEGRQVVRLIDPRLDKVLWERPVEFGAKGCLSGQEALGIFESGGKFTLIRLPDGKVLVEPKESGRVHAENSLTSIYVLSTPEAYLLVTNGAPTHIPQAENIRPAPDTGSNPLINGRVYSFDRATGKRLWGPVKIDQQGLMLSQPDQLPVLTFARHVHRSAANGQPDVRTSVLCIDKRNGRIVYNEDRVLPTQIQNFQLLGDHADDTVSIMLPGKTVVLKFTDKEIPPEEKQPDASKGKSGAADSVGKALGKVLEGALQPLKKAKPQENDDD